MTPTEKLREIAIKLNVLEISKVVLDDGRFPFWSGSSKPMQHHYGTGGLAQHTFEVADLCLRNNEYYKGTPKFIEEDKLFLAALFHDAGKMWDYGWRNGHITIHEPMLSNSVKDLKLGFEGSDVFNAVWSGMPHKRHIHHISRSGIVWSKAFDDFNYREIKETDEWADEILHAILAHHGQREWGSPVAPNTRLAWLLHLCDGISARMDDAEKWDQIR